MLDFQRYQLAFAAHLRSPKTAKRPAKVADVRMAVYREIVFNNIFGSVSACFPVCKSILGKRGWHKLVRQFFAKHQATTPIFREIPQEFLKFMPTVENLPAYFQQLAHYEWVELYLTTLPIGTTKVSKNIDLLNESPVLNPASMLLEYDYPVQKISPKFKPKNVEKTYLLVFRNIEFYIKFIEINSMAYQLLSLLEVHSITGKQALTDLAKNMQHPNADVMVGFGFGILEDLASQQAIVGSAKK